MMVRIQHQTNVILTRIEHHFASINSQVSFPSAPLPPPPFLDFNPSSSDVRVNAFWFTSLVFSLSTALLATLVQQWVRNHMQVFRDGRPLKSARLRQYLYEGLEGSHMLFVAQLVPGLLHISLFLFFVGLCDSLWHQNKTVFYSTVGPIALCGLFYLFTTIAPVITPQWPYQNPLSGLFWYLFQRWKIWGRHPGKERKPVSSEMAQRQMQLAMEQTEGRKDRDKGAIQWLFNNVTEDTEMESFALAIPGSFEAGWGEKVWEKVLETGDGNSTPGPLVNTENGAPQSSSVRGRQPFRFTRLIRSCQPRDKLSPPSDNIYNELCQRIGSLLQTCTNRGLFTNEDARLKRIRACIDVVALLVFKFRAELDWFGEIRTVLGELGLTETLPASAAGGTHPLLTARWTCLSFVAIREMLRDSQLGELAKYAVSGLARFQSSIGASDEDALASAEEIDRRLEDAWIHVEDLNRAFEHLDPSRPINPTEVRQILDGHGQQVSGLEGIKGETDAEECVDWRISLLRDAIDKVTHRLTRRLPGASFNEFWRTEPTLVSEAFSFHTIGSTPVLPPLVFPEQQLWSFHILGRKLHDINTHIIDGTYTGGYEEALRSLKSINQIPVPLRRVKHPMKRQLWRLLDLRDGSGLGYTVELFFLALRQLESNDVFYKDTFEDMTSQWRGSKDLFGTQQILLNLICDLVIQGRGIFSDHTYPENITGHLLTLTVHILGEYIGDRGHIEEVVRELRDVPIQHCFDKDFRVVVLEALNRFGGPG
jgi:Family of unknown function (DUF6535)